MSRITSDRRIEYAGSVHDEREIEAVVEVLRAGPTALRIGKNVKAMEKRVAELFAKRRGVMCNSGSSALYLAIEVLDLEPGDNVLTLDDDFPNYQYMGAARKTSWEHFRGAVDERVSARREFA